MARGLPCSLGSYAGRIKKVTRSEAEVASWRDDSRTVPASHPPSWYDCIAGNLGNAGVIAAFRRCAREGGSYHVRVNLSRRAIWLMSLGQVDEAELPKPGPESGLGPLETIRPMTP